MLKVTSCDLLEIKCPDCGKSNVIPVQSIIEAGFNEVFECDDCLFPLFIVSLGPDHD